MKKLIHIPPSEGAQESVRVYLQVPDGVDSRRVFSQVVSAMFGSRVTFDAPIQVMQGEDPRLQELRDEVERWKVTMRAMGGAI